MTSRELRQRRKTHRAEERRQVRMARYFLAHRDYVRAFQHLAWALQQSTAADATDSEIVRDKVARIQKVQRRESPTKGQVDK
jgi:hypothetical protein